MKKRPISVTIISWIFIIFGALMFIAALLPLFGIGASQASAVPIAKSIFDLSLVLIIRLLAVICGVFMLKGSNWARWVLIIWTGFHVIISIGGAPFVLIMHSLIFVIVLYLLLRPAVSYYFRKNEI